MLLVALAPSQDLGRVTKLLRDTITIYDANGNPRGREPKWDLPRDGAPIVGRDTAGHVGIRRGNEIVYLRNSEILTAGVPDPCAPLSQGARPAGKVSAASEGVGSGMGSSSTPCVRQ